MSLPLTIPVLLAIMPRAGGKAAAFIGPLSQAMARWEISDSVDRVAAFLAQAAHESGELQSLVENLNYSAEALMRLWPNRFTPDDAKAMQRRPGRIADRVYADRMGNGPESSGDGWRFRGRGIFQLTGRENYTRASSAITGDAGAFLFSPDLVSEPEYACETAGWYWHSHALNRFADAGDFEGLTRAINGGLNGLDDRLKYWHRATEALQ